MYLLVNNHTKTPISIPQDQIVEVIRPIFERGARAMADHVRSYVHAAYGGA